MSSTTATASPPPSVQLISRRLLLQYEQELRQAAKGSKAPKKSMKTAPKDDTPWPRNVVYGAYAAMAVFIPYTAAWFLSTNARLRSRLLPDDAASWRAQLLDSMRHHFGVPDWDCLSEPETVFVPTLPHKFVDEPTARIRQQQAWIQRFGQQGTVRVQITSENPEKDVDSNDTSFLHPSSVHVLELPAKTLARPEAIAKVVPDNVVIRPPLALDFLDGEDAPETSVTITAVSPDHTPVVPILSIYSLWHYQAPSSSSESSNVGNMSPQAIEMSRLNYDIERLEAELQQASSSHRSIDEIQAELAQLKSARRRLQWKKLLSWG